MVCPYHLLKVKLKPYIDIPWATVHNFFYLKVRFGLPKSVNPETLTLESAVWFRQIFLHRGTKSVLVDLLTLLNPIVSIYIFIIHDADTPSGSAQCTVHSTTARLF